MIYKVNWAIIILIIYLMQGDKRVGIVGAGPAGLMAARYAIMNGF